ncbi:hypothetical protein ACFCVO_17080 [Agromyces sp. NPDC056379]|uniref:hypothetical protein n=1 Tax=unclassified Agromyces TaxID=2639701 RepID=UPI0035D750B8
MTNVNYPGVSYWSWSSNPADGAVGGVYMEPAAGAALVAMLTAYHNEVGGYLNVNEGYRSFAGQQYWSKHSEGTAAPGYSNHGWGQAFDFDPGLLTRSQHSWVMANRARFGYDYLGSGVFQEFDWMHFNYTGAPTGPSTEHPQPKEEIDMLIIQFRTGLQVDGKSLDYSVWAISGKGLRMLTSTAWNAGGAELAAAYGGLRVMGDNAFSRVLDANNIPWTKVEQAFRSLAFVAA